MPVVLEDPGETGHPNDFVDPMVVYSLRYKASSHDQTVEGPVGEWQVFVDRSDHCLSSGGFWDHVHICSHICRRRICHLCGLIAGHLCLMEYPVEWLSSN